MLLPHRSNLRVDPFTNGTVTSSALAVPFKSRSLSVYVNHERGAHEFKIDIFLLRRLRWGGWRPIGVPALQSALGSH